MAMHVDDLLVTMQDVAEARRVLEVIREYVKVKEKGIPMKFLRIYVEIKEEKIWSSQKKLIEKP